MPLTGRPVTIPLRGLDGSSDSKFAPLGTLDLIENAMATRRTAEGVELRKRYGLTALANTVTTGSTPTAGKKLGARGNELVKTDGHQLYSWNGATDARWTPRGALTDLAAQVDRISANYGLTPMDVDVAYTNGYLCFVVTRRWETPSADDGLAEWFVHDATTGALVAGGTLIPGAATDAFTARVVASSNAFFVFWWDEVTTISCKKITAATTVTIDASATTVASNVGAAVPTATAPFDVIWNATSSNILVAYQNSTSGLTLKAWNTDMTAGTTVADATRNPNQGIGFLDYTFANGSGYVVIGTSATGLRLWTFNATTLAMTADTLVDGAATGYSRVTGYFSTVPNLFYTPNIGSTTTPNRKIMGWRDGTGWTVQRSMGLASRSIAIDGKRYVLGSYIGIQASSRQNSLFMLEIPVDASSLGTGTSSVVNPAGLLVQGNLSACPNIRSNACLVAVSATRAVATCSLVEQIATPTSTTRVEQHSACKVTLDWSGSLTGRPVEFNDVLYLPAAAPKIFDGTHVMEAGPYLYPEAPSLTATASGVLTPLGTYTFTAVYFRFDATGKLWESAESYPATITLTGADDGVDIVVPTLRVTNDYPYSTVAPAWPWRIAIYRTKNGETSRYLMGVLDNDATVDSVTFFGGGLADASIDDNAVVYTSAGQVENVAPPCVLSFETFGGRMFAACGDRSGGSVWHTKKNVDGKAAQFSDFFRLPLDGTGGPLTGLVPLETSIVATKRNALYPITGDGPTNDGGSPFPTPLKMAGENGMVRPGAYTLTPTGAIVTSAKGKYLLDRGGSMQPVPGADAYDSLTVTGGVTLDDRPFACLVTSDGTTLVRDWEFNLWYAWTGQAAVSCCRWQNKLVLLSSDGTVKYETVGTWADGASAIAMKVRTHWLLLGQLAGFSRIWEIQTLVEVMSSCTYSLRLGYDHATAVPSAITKALTTANVGPVGTQPARQECNALQMTLEESSTTEGMRLSGWILDAGFEPRGLKPLGSSQRF